MLDDLPGAEAFLESLDREEAVASHETVVGSGHFRARFARNAFGAHGRAQPIGKPGIARRGASRNEG